MINRDAANRRRGRPRGFDSEAALLAAAKTFWRLGYEGASIVDLTHAMGITPQSLYAAFGSKAQLYRQALSQYKATAGAFAMRALTEEPTAAGAVTRLLREAAHEFSRPDRLPGCMISTGSVTCGEDHAEIADHVAALRAEMLGAIAARLARGVAQGDLAPSADPARLARYVQAILQGMSLQATDGAGEADLAAIADVACAAIEKHAVTVPA